jgi:hypothetical protein
VVKDGRTWQRVSPGLGDFLVYAPLIYNVPKLVTCKNGEGEKGRMGEETERQKVIPGRNTGVKVKIEDVLCFQ